MAVTRLILLLVVIGILTLLLVQNWSPVLSLVFLANRSIPLPLAVWVFLSTAAGAVTSLVMTSLFKVSNYFGEPQRSRRTPSVGTSPRTRVTPREEFQTPPSQPAASKTESGTSNAFDDWETNDGSNDDWDFDEQQPPTPQPRPQTPPVRDSQTYERPQTPESSSQSGSVYSYSYRQPKNTAVGKTESVYDADYRVIIPPPSASQVDTSTDDEDDWSFFEDDDDDFTDDEQNPPKK
jgi:uncharacterized integral membrane protein